MTEEEKRLERARAGDQNWKLWGPYVSERAWGTVREDYSANGTAWDYFPHDHARSRAYRWSEDGIAGICDERQWLCFALALWNGADPILKERFFGLTNGEGNHGEDVKEYYYYLDNTPTHSYMKLLYKYPQEAFPYGQLVEVNRQRGRDKPEFELIDTGVFDEDRYFDVTVEYAKSGPDDILILLSATNRGPDAARLDLLPTIWFRNNWSWETVSEIERPRLSVSDPARPDPSVSVIRADHPKLGSYFLSCQNPAGTLELLFTENETNNERLFPGGVNPSPYVKDGINNYVTQGRPDLVNSAQVGTKASARYQMTIGPGETSSVRLRLSHDHIPADALGASFDQTFAARKKDANEFYATVAPGALSEDTRSVQRQSLAGLLWSKQFYHYKVEKWLQGDTAQPLPPNDRWDGRNRNWKHLYNYDIISMPDKWEYPWYAAWDLAFHCIPLALVDSDFAKNQLILLLRERYMHPNGQLPAYEWAFGDVNPPVHAWAALRVYEIERRIRGVGDTMFLSRIFHKLLINFTWWVNRKDANGRNIFEGGFLGLDNIGVFDRSAKLPSGGHLDQSDGTSWMAMYCLNMLRIALELAHADPTYEDVAAKFLEHFFYIGRAMNDRPAVRGDDGIDLWDENENEGFYYDVLHFPNGEHQFLRVRSMVGLIPLFAVGTVDVEWFDALPAFRRRLDWFMKNRPDLCEGMTTVTKAGEVDRRHFAVVNEDRLRKLLSRMLNEDEFLSPHGIRSVSRRHLEHPFRLSLDGQTFEVGYQPAESTSGLFGGNSNWRGPIWFPMNYLLIEALQRFDYFYGESFTVECPVGSGKMLTLAQVATELSQRLIKIFTRDENGRRAVFGNCEKFQTDPHFRDLIPFHEYFHGDTAAGLGASHQTGWTALVAKLIQQSGK